MKKKDLQKKKTEIQKSVSGIDLIQEKFNHFKKVEFNYFLYIP
jgi:hypothetical protein